MWVRPNRSWVRNAVTIGQTTYYSVSKEIVDANPAWRKHENEHQRQWREVPFFLVRYIWQTIIKGYTDNMYEVSARAAERR